MAGDRLLDDPEYVQGQLAVDRVLILSLVKAIGCTNFFPIALQDLEKLKARKLAKPVAENHLLAIDSARVWIENVSAAFHTRGPRQSR